MKIIGIVAGVPMQEPTFLVLTALAGPPLHGYGIMQAVAELSRGAVTIRPGTLYAALDRLTVEGLVEVDHEDEWAAGRVRRFYRLTAEGSRALGAEARHRRELAATAARRLAALSARRPARPADAHPAAVRPTGARPAAARAALGPAAGPAAHPV